MALSRYFPVSLADVPGWMPRRTMILLVMAILIYQGTGIFYKVLVLQLIRAKPAATAEQAGPAAVQIPRPPLGAYGIIAERNVFGVTVGADGRTQGTAMPKATAPQHDLANLLDLRGTVAGEGQYGFAIVEEKSAKTQRLVKAGSVIAGATVVRIKRNAVDFRMSGREYTLKIVERVERSLIPPAPGRPVVQPSRASGPSGPIVVKRTEIMEALQDMGTMLRQAQVRPYFSAGKPDGFLISNIVQGSLYQQLGILDGDIIQGVNNRRIQTADDVMSLFNILKESSHVSLMLRRRGNQQTLNYQFQ